MPSARRRQASGSRTPTTKPSSCSPTSLHTLEPGVPVVGEEAPPRDPSIVAAATEHERVWLLDPLDGTRSFIAGSPDFATMIALVEHGVTTAAWVWQPVHAHMFVAVRGRGARPRRRAVAPPHGSRRREPAPRRPAHQPDAPAPAASGRGRPRPPPAFGNASPRRGVTYPLAARAYSTTRSTGGPCPGTTLPASSSPTRPAWCPAVSTAAPTGRGTAAVGLLTAANQQVWDAVRAPAAREPRELSSKGLKFPSRVAELHQCDSLPRGGADVVARPGRRPPQPAVRPRSIPTVPRRGRSYTAEARRRRRRPRPPSRPIDRAAGGLDLLCMSTLHRRTLTAVVARRRLRRWACWRRPGVRHSTDCARVADTHARPVAGCPVFPANNWWHADISDLPRASAQRRVAASHVAALAAAPGLRARLRRAAGALRDPGHRRRRRPPHGPGPVRRTRARATDVRYPLGEDTKIEGGRRLRAATGTRSSSTSPAAGSTRRGTPDSVDGRWRAGSGAVWDLRSNALRPRRLDVGRRRRPADPARAAAAGAR